jgi:hypothetical protein
MNAKEELLNVLEKNSLKIKCAFIEYSLDWSSGQELYGTVWLEDGTWLSRGEYDGSEWWEHNVLPPIPIECI